MFEHADLPGADLVEAGIADLHAGRETAAALLVSMARERLVAVGIPVPVNRVPHPGHRLYDLLADDGDDAHGRYNALVRRLVSFARAAEHASAR